jgi:hypothetical protein
MIGGKINADYHGYSLLKTPCPTFSKSGGVIFSSRASNVSERSPSD